jgi:hypothetical protein
MIAKALEFECHIEIAPRALPLCHERYEAQPIVPPLDTANGRNQQAEPSSMISQLD